MQKLINRVAILAGIKWYANTQATELYSCSGNDRAVYLVAQYPEGVDSRALQLRRTRACKRGLRLYIATLGMLRSTDGMLDEGALLCQVKF